MKRLTISIAVLLSIENIGSVHAETHDETKGNSGTTNLGRSRMPKATRQSKISIDYCSGLPVIRFGDSIGDYYISVIDSNNTFVFEEHIEIVFTDILYPLFLTQGSYLIKIVSDEAIVFSDMITI